MGRFSKCLAIRLTYSTLNVSLLGWSNIIHVQCVGLSCRLMTWNMKIGRNERRLQQKRSEERGTLFKGANGCTCRILKYHISVIKVLHTFSFGSSTGSIMLPRLLFRVVA